MLGLEEKCNHFSGFPPGSRELAVGNWVYYIPKGYSIRKSRIKEMYVIKGTFPLDFDRCEILLEDGVTVDYNDTFDSMRDALEYIIASLKADIDYHKMQLFSLQKKIELEERLRKMYEEKVEKKKECMPE